MTAEMLPPGNSSAILKREFDGAVAAGAPEALIRFIARHPGHPLAADASERLGRMGSASRPLATDADPDAVIYRAFDIARRADTRNAYRAFAKRYSTHPLAAEATRRSTTASR